MEESERIGFYSIGIKCGLAVFSGPSPWLPMPFTPFGTWFPRPPSSRGSKSPSGNRIYSPMAGYVFSDAKVDVHLTNSKSLEEAVQQMKTLP